jgi:hypothetical protein
MDGPERKRDSNLVAKEAETSSSSTGLARGNQSTRREAVLPAKGRILFRSRWFCGPLVEWRAAATARRWGKESELGASGCSSAPGASDEDWPGRCGGRRRWWLRRPASGDKGEGRRRGGLVRGIMTSGKAIRVRGTKISPDDER